MTTKTYQSYLSVEQARLLLSGLLAIEHKLPNDKKNVQLFVDTFAVLNGILDDDFAEKNGTED